MKKYLLAFTKLLFFTILIGVAETFLSKRRLYINFYLTMKALSYLRLVKFAHTIFAMPFALIGFFLGTESSVSSFSWFLLILVMACMVFARNAAMSFNRYIDKEFDAENPRTSLREIPAKVLSARSVLIFTLVNSLLFIISTWFINPLCFYLSPLALFIVLGYSYTKRFTAFSHMVLGIGLALAPIGAYLAVTGLFAIQPILLGIAVFLWVSGFDIIYALQDTEFDRAKNLKSLPALLGKKKALIISMLLHLLSMTFLFVFGLVLHSAWLYWLGWSGFTLLLIRQHVVVRPNDLSRVNLAFFTLNGIASIFFAVFAIAEILVN